MSKSKQFAVLERTPEGVPLIFNTIQFNDLFRTFKSNTGKKYDETLTIIADELHVSPSTVAGWLKDYNGTRDIEIVKRIASFFHLADYHILLTEAEERSNEQMPNNQKSVYEMNAARRMYECLVETFRNYYKIFFKRLSGGYFSDERDDLLVFPDTNDDEPDDLYWHARFELRKLSLDFPPPVQDRILGFLNHYFRNQDDCYEYIPEEDDDDYHEFDTFLKDNPSLDSKFTQYLGFVVGRQEDTYRKLNDLFKDYIGY